MTRLFFIGAGKMATAIAGGLVRSGCFQAEELKAYDISPQAAELFEKSTGVRCFSGEFCEAELEASRAVLLAVKPQYLTEALTGYKSILESKLIISIAAGVTLSQLYDLTDSTRIVRVMPNTPALIARGCAAAAMTDGVTAEERATVEQIFSSVGSFAVVEERRLNAVTGLAGSGPAYVFEFIQALADGGVAEGLPRELALDLAARTVAGAAEMVIQTRQHPAVLCDQVASPAGTTIRGLERLARMGFKGAVMAAVRSGAARAEELGKS
ncbi:MAG: pyrroline-5-carboxylate reductase [Victivallaceae bacterium]